ncbi:hypothetical protein J2W68_003617 [Luteimonas terrae]|uniref:Uncharacterized protein n=1 Tax=Luteimonas terrae TaxID=1530191 RepID=A0ABU1Y1Z9_9GAMM|nr:hypothetical protein [Luteimonas terrae]
MLLQLVHLQLEERILFVVRLGDAD